MSTVLNESILDSAIHNGRGGIETAEMQRKLFSVPERWAAGFEENFGKLIAIPRSAVDRLVKRKNGTLAPKGQEEVVVDVASEYLTRLVALYTSVLPGIYAQRGTREVALFPRRTPKTGH